MSELKAKQAAVEILKRDLGKAEATATRRLELLRRCTKKLVEIDDTDPWLGLDPLLDDLAKELADDS